MKESIDATGEPVPDPIVEGNRITDGTQSSSIGEKQSYTSKQCFKLSKL